MSASGWEFWVLALHAGATLAMVGVIWICQLVHYPLFALVGPDSFERYERSHMRRIGPIVMPLMVAEAVTAGMILFAGVGAVPRGLAWAGFTLVVVLAVSTATLQGPTHARLAREGFDERLVNRLVRTNWIRTVAWTTRGVIALSMLAPPPAT